MNDLSAVNYKNHISNKLVWMSRQLRHFNDPVSIIHWANAMRSGQDLLLIPVAKASTGRKSFSIDPIPSGLSKAVNNSQNILPFTVTPSVSTSLNASSTTIMPVDLTPTIIYKSTKNVSMNSVPQPLTTSDHSKRITKVSRLSVPDKVTNIKQSMYPHPKETFPVSKI